MERFTTRIGVSAGLRIYCVIVALFSQSGSNAVTTVDLKSIDSTRITVSARQIWETRRHSGPVWSIAFSPDGKSLASASWDQSVNVWEPLSGALLKTLRRKLEILTVAFAPDGKTLAIGGYDKRVSLLDPNTLASESQLEPHTEYVSSVAFSADNRLIASGSWDNKIRLWERTSGRLLRVLKQDDSVSRIAFSPNGRALASSSKDPTISVWDVQTGKLFLSLQRPNAEHWLGQSVAYSPDGSLIAGEAEGEVILWNAESGAVEKVLQDDEMRRKWVTAIAFSPNGAILANGSWNNKVKLWDLNSGTLLRTIQLESMPTRSLAFSPDGTLLAIGSYGLLSVWEVQK